VQAMSVVGLVRTPQSVYFTLPSLPDATTRCQAGHRVLSTCPDCHGCPSLSCSTRLGDAARIVAWSSRSQLAFPPCPGILASNMLRTAIRMRRLLRPRSLACPLWQPWRIFAPWSTTSTTTRPQGWCTRHAEQCRARTPSLSSPAQQPMRPIQAASLRLRHGKVCRARHMKDQQVQRGGMARHCSLAAQVLPAPSSSSGHPARDTTRMRRSQGRLVLRG
jgi:hypothetical protein